MRVNEILATSWQLCVRQKKFPETAGELAACKTLASWQAVSGAREAYKKPLRGHSPEDLTTMSLLMTKESYRKRAILRALLQLYVDHSTIEEGLSIADVSTTLSLSRAHIEVVVETLLSEGYLYSTIDDDHHKSTE